MNSHKDINTKYLTWQMTKREILGRYRGSMMGILWSFVTPLIMLMVYTFVFSYVFKARWGVGAEQSHVSFAIHLFAGILIYNFFSEVIMRAPTIILGQSNYVKKVIFPLPILPLSVVFSALFHLAIGLVVFLLFFVITEHTLLWTTLLFPIVILPFFLLVLGLAWFLSALGVYVRDMSYVINLLMTVCMFFSPLFYPIDMLPKAFHLAIYLNPISLVIEQSRQVLVEGVVPSLVEWLYYFLISGVVVTMSYAFFQKVKKGFADVL